MNAVLRWDGIDSLRQWLLRALGRLQDRARLHEQAGRAITDWVGRNFESEGSLATETSGGWPALASRTLAERRRRGLGTRPLQATGRLRAGVSARSDIAGVTVDDPVPYAAQHQFGLGVPARPFLPTAAQAGRIVDPVVETFIGEALR
jgi:phage gpG-like protein